MPESRSIVVINYTAPELNHLAAELAETGLLKCYVRPYANQGRDWERWLEGLLSLGAFYQQTLGRRVMPDGFTPSDIREVATVADFAKAALRIFPAGFHSRQAERLGWRMQNRIAVAGMRYANGADIVIATCIVARRAFEQTSGRRILNYPIAHYNFIRRLLAEEAQLEPAFASSISEWERVPRVVEQSLDAECALADSILVGSTFVRDTFVAEGVPAEKLVVIPYGTDITRFSPPDRSTLERVAGDQSEGFRILFVGQLSQRKGLSYLLHAYDDFRGAGTSLTLVGSYTGEPKAMAPYRAHVRHIPHVPQQVLASLYRRADVFVFPTLVEGLPLTVVEAMASGLPVIATSHGPSDVIRDGVDGFIVPIRDPNAITAKLEYLRKHPDERIAMGRNARERALQFSWSAYRRAVFEYLCH